jgi:uncharacterized protein YlzI (FlbEa/FlbD family)
MRYMIRLTLENDRPIYTSIDKISQITPGENYDTLVTMTNGDKFIVQEAADTVASYFQTCTPR